MSSFLRVDQLSHRYNATLPDHTLRSVTFSVEAGHICAVVGASGSGKTTLLRLISGLIEANQGAVWLSRQRVRGPSQNLVPGHPDIRTVFQDFALAPSLSVYHNIAHPMRAYHRDYCEARTRELIERFQLQGHEDQLPATLSGGEKQRVALARAIAEEPPLLLLDEPFSQVDPPLKNRLMHEVIDILKEISGTALFVTHDARDALAWSDQVVVLCEGKLVQQGTPQQVYEQPITAYVAQLMGECSLVPIDTFCQWFPNYSPDNGKQVGIRPEHIRLTDSPQQGVPARVLRTNYQGASYELLVQVEEGGLLLVHHPNEVADNTRVLLNIAVEKVYILED